jgi:hypothetical protein
MRAGNPMTLPPGATICCDAGKKSFQLYPGEWMMFFRFTVLPLWAMLAA